MATSQQLLPAALESPSALIDISEFKRSASNALNAAAAAAAVGGGNRGGSQADGSISNPPFTTTSSSSSSSSTENRHPPNVDSESCIAWPWQMGGGRPDSLLAQSLQVLDKQQRQAPTPTPTTSSSADNNSTTSNANANTALADPFLVAAATGLRNGWIHKVRRQNNNTQPPTATTTANNIDNNSAAASSNSSCSSSTNGNISSSQLNSSFPPYNNNSNNTNYDNNNSNINDNNIINNDNSSSLFFNDYPYSLALDADLDNDTCFTSVSNNKTNIDNADTNNWPHSELNLPPPISSFIPPIFSEAAVVSAMEEEEEGPAFLVCTVSDIPDVTDTISSRSSSSSSRPQQHTTTPKRKYSKVKQVNIDARAQRLLESFESCGLECTKFANRPFIHPRYWHIFSQKNGAAHHNPSTTSSTSSFSTQSTTITTTTASTSTARLPTNEILLTVEIYPNHKVIGKRPSAEFLFAGSQRLTALRDAFNCVADFMVYGCHDEEEGGDDEIVETMTTGAEVVAEDEAVEGGEPVEVQFNRVGQSLSRSGGQDDTLADTGVTVIRRRRNPRKQQGLAMATTKTTSASSSISLQPTNAVSAAHQKEEEEDIIIPTKRRRGRPKKIKETTHNSNVPVAIGIEPLLPPSQTTTTTTTTTARKKPPASIFISSQETNDPHQQQPYVDLDFLKSNAVRNTHSRKTSASCLAIERVLYDDTRDAGVERYSTNIVEWAREEMEQVERLQDSSFHEINMPRTVLYTAGVMDETRFEDLRVRLNFPYLLMHQGKCEHLVVFTEVRLAHPSDDQDIRNYPKRLRIDSTLKTPVCGICAVFSASWITTNDMYADQDPFLWCDSCYREFHFVVAKKKGNEKEEEKEKEEEEEEQLSYPGFTAIPFYISKEF